jgi:hypothetical protein
LLVELNSLVVSYTIMPIPATITIGNKLEKENWCEWGLPRILRRTDNISVYPNHGVKKPTEEDETSVTESLSSYSDSSDLDDSVGSFVIARKQDRDSDMQLKKIRYQALPRQPLSDQRSTLSDIVDRLMTLKCREICKKMRSEQIEKVRDVKSKNSRVSREWRGDLDRTFHSIRSEALAKQPTRRSVQHG